MHYWDFIRDGSRERITVRPFLFISIDYTTWRLHSQRVLHSCRHPGPARPSGDLWAWRSRNMCVRAVSFMWPAVRDEPRALTRTCSSSSSWCSAVLVLVAKSVPTGYELLFFFFSNRRHPAGNGILSSVILFVLPSHKHTAPITSAAPPPPPQPSTQTLTSTLHRGSQGDYTAVCVCVCLSYFRASDI